MIERWELSHFPSAKDPQRYRLKLKATADDLKRLGQKLPVTLSQPFKTLSTDYNWACYLFQLGDTERAEVERFLRELCPQGIVTTASVQVDHELSPLLEDFLETTAEQLGGEGKKEILSVSSAVPPSQPAAGVPSKGPTLDFGSTLNPRYTFDEFVIGPHNRFTHAAALAVAETPGRIYNPLFIYGSVGLGKTHLMQAIAHQLSQRQSSLTILYLPAERLIHHVIEATRQGVIHQLPEQFKTVDLLLVDDVQFLANSEETQEQFFHIFNLLRENNKQIVLTSDRPPKQLSTLADRIRTRFEWGLIADMKAPTLETRVAILKKKATGMGEGPERKPLELSEDLLVYIATRLTELRAMEGFLQQVHARTALAQQAVTMDLVKQLMEELLTEPSVPSPQPPLAVSVPPSPVVTSPPPPPAALASPAEARAAELGVEGGVEMPVEEGTLKPLEVAFFSPEDAQAELTQVKERFSQIIKKHKLKFQLVSRLDRGYLPTKAGSEREIVAHCQAHQLSIAVVLGPPSGQHLAHEDFLGQLMAATEESKILLLWIPWSERAKDYRYLNLVLDLTLTRIQ
ncbi:MAG: chromosomal replication initiator protein DnaA [Elusimicrobia bacterium]|nr:chromosomal replication initiator protein DnaA [Elusimicrobiota bacterium]